MDDFFDSWEHVAPCGSHTWSDYPGSDDDSALHKAAFSGDIARLGALIIGLDDVDVPNDYRQSPLYLAVRGNQAEAACILLSAGADPGQDCLVDDHGPPPLSVVESAAYHGCNHALIAAADHGVKLSTSTLYWAALGGHVECVFTILNRLSSDGLRDTGQQYTISDALQAAATNHHLQIVEILLSDALGYSKVTTAVDKDVLTSAMLCLLTDQSLFDGATKVYPSNRSNTMSILQLLISAGAEVDSRAFWAAAGHPKWTDIILYLLEHGLQVHDTRYWNHFNCCEPDDWQIENEWEPMILTVVRTTREDAVVLTAFLAAGASLLVRDKHGNTPLHLAASVSAVDLLLQPKADLHALNAAGQTPLYTACLHNHLDVARSLLLHDADVRSIVQDRHWLSLMSDSISHDWWWSINWTSDTDKYRVELAKFLLLHGANVQATTNDGLTALHMAAIRGDIELMSVLLAHGDTIGTTTKTGQTVLHFACAYSRGPGSRRWPSRDGMSLPEHSIRFLLNHGADVDAKDDCGATPLLYLLRWVLDTANWTTKAVNLLLEKGADLEAKAHGDDRTARSYIDQSDRWMINKIGLLEALPAKPSHARSNPSMSGRGRGRGRGRGSYRTTWT